MALGKKISDGFCDERDPKSLVHWTLKVGVDSNRRPKGHARNQRIKRLIWRKEWGAAYNNNDNWFEIMEGELRGQYIDDCLFSRTEANPQRPQKY